MLAQKCAALIQVNAEIRQRCVALPVPCSVKGARDSSWELEWAWLDLPRKAEALAQELHWLGPIAFRLCSAAELLEVLHDKPHVLGPLLSLLEAHQLALGRLEEEKEEALATLRCLARDAVKIYPLPWRFTHPLIGGFAVGALDSGEQRNALARLLALPDVEVEKTVSQRSVACSWLALVLYGHAKLKTCQLFDSAAELRSGIYLQHNGKLFRGFVLESAGGLVRFSFRERSTYVFGQLETERRSAAELPASKRLQNLTDSAELAANSLYWPLA